MFELLNDDATAPLIVTAEHAGQEFPDGTLGIDTSLFATDRNLPFDTGVRDAAMWLCTRLGCTGVLGRVSRLVIDLNRTPDDPNLIVERAHGYAAIPQNRNLSPAERQRRFDNYYAPYHAAIAAQIERRQRASVTPWLFSLHSFTPAVGYKLMGRAEPVPSPHLALLYDHHHPHVDAFRDALRAMPDLIWVENEPYDLVQAQLGTLPRYRHSHGVTGLLIEMNISYLQQPEESLKLADRLATLIANAEEILAKTR